MAKVGVNTCSAKELATVPGISQDQAQHLCWIRARLGDFSHTSFFEWAGVVGITQPIHVRPPIPGSVNLATSN